MKINTKFFGEVEIADDKIITFDKGIIGFPELTKAGNIIVGNTFKALQVWGIVAVMYMVVIITLSRVAKRIERRINVGKLEAN